MMLSRPFRRPQSFSSPWRELDRLQRDMNRLFADMGSESQGRTAPSYPAMNVWTNEDGAVITAELPGMNADDIDISITGDALTLRGDRAADDLGENGKYHRRERNIHSFSRTIQLPFAVEAEQVEARFEKGILHISLPRAEAEKPKKIAVSVAS